MPEVDEQLGDLDGPAAVVGHRPIHHRAGDITVEQHRGCRARPHQLGSGGVIGHRHEYRAVGGAGIQQHLQPAIATGAGALVEQRHPVSGAAELRVQFLDQLGIEGVRDVGENQRDGAGALRRDSEQRRSARIQGAPPR